MSRQIHICLYNDLLLPDKNPRVRIEYKDTLERLSPNGWVLCSQSPIFPLSKKPFVPGNKDSYRIVFIVHKQPFVQIGKLTTQFHKYFWYSLGITSLVVILPKKITTTSVLKILNFSEILCYEVWTIGSEVLSKPKVVIPKRKAIQMKDSWPKKMPENPDLKRLIAELHLNFNSLIKRARMFMPSLLPTMEQVRLSVGSEVDEIVKQEAVLQNSKENTQTSSGQSKARESEITNSCLISHKSINMSVDALVQLNSALAYILSQSFYGGPPLGRNLALNSCHSLLGIGTAITALQKLSEFIILGFAKFPISKVVREHYHDVTLENFLNDKGSPSGNKTLDSYILKEGNSRQTPKLAYFSTRMGFSEHSYCVTAATQSLASADESRRNLLTITHELLHSHVKGLFATILIEHDSQTEALTGHIQRYRKHVATYKKKPSSQTGWTVMEFLRFRIFLFCDTIYKVTKDYPGCEVNGIPENHIGFGPSKNYYEEIDRFKCSFGFLNEIVVHVLDLHYFYDASKRIYLATLWNSWATVPGVADKIEWYILRGIVAVSVTNISKMNRDDFDGLKTLLQTSNMTLDEQFNDSINTLTSILEELCAKDNSGPMLRAVLAKLKSSPTKLWLREAFVPCYMFAQIVKQFLYSPDLREYFDSLKDTLADRDEEDEPIYKLQPLEFSARPIQNPFALLRSRLRQDIDGDNTLDEETRSAWLFLTLASLQQIDKLYETS